MSNDGLPAFFSEIHAKIRTPWKTNLSMGFVSLFAGLVPSDLGHMVSIGTLLAFVLVCFEF
jgi:APA family basic amino acid/polyamine antiporter